MILVQGKVYVWHYSEIFVVYWSKHHREQVKKLTLDSKELCYQLAAGGVELMFILRYFIQSKFDLEMLPDKFENCSEIENFKLIVFVF